jgi:hypothetical protein
MAVVSAELESLPSLPWGEHDRLPLRLPSGWPEPLVSRPDTAGAIDDYAACLNRALDEPLGSEPIERIARPGMRVAIVVDDPSRWTPIPEALTILLARLRGAGVAQEDVSICLGVGRHHAVDTTAIRKRVGDRVAGAYRCLCPPIDDVAQYAELGTMGEGIPVRVFRPVAEANLCVLVGSVLPHLQAGFGGGYKLIFPGTSHRSTLGAIHRVGLDGDAGRLLGSDNQHNPMRCAIRAAAAFLPGRCFSVSHILGSPGQVFQVRAGHPDSVQEVLADEARRRFRVPEGQAADLVVAGNSPWPGDPMQSFKVLLHHRAASARGGVLVGFFWTDPAEIDRSFPLPALRTISGAGRVGGWAIRAGLKTTERVLTLTGSSSLFMVRWARELVVDRTVLVYAPPLHARLGPRLGPVRLFAHQESLWRAATRALRAGAPSRIRIFPEGGLTYCPQPASP